LRFHFGNFMLTKSFFSLAMSCPRKLFYSGNYLYCDASGDNTFLKSLATAGFQVGALAKLLFPDGVCLDGLLTQSALVKTEELLQSDAVTIFQQRYVQLARQKEPRKAKPSKAAPVRRPQQPKQPQSSVSSPNIQKDAEGRAKQLSSIQQGIRQADPSLADQRRAALGKVNGAQNDEVQFQKAAKAIAK
jgi:hypothetical protein